MLMLKFHDLRPHFAERRPWRSNTRRPSNRLKLHKAMEQIPSVNIPLNVEASGFSMADDAAHMIAMLGRGSNFRLFVTNDLEGELYAQTPGAQLLSITCKEAPRLETSAAQNSPGNSAIVTGVSVTFLLALRIQMADGTLWNLDVEHTYDAVNVHLNDGRRTLAQNFSVVSHQRVTVTS